MPVKESTRSSRRVARCMAKPNPGASTSRMTSQDPAAGPSKMASEDPAAGSSKMGDQDRGAGPRKMSSQDPDAGPRKMSSQDHAAGSSKMGDQDSGADSIQVDEQAPGAGPSMMGDEGPGAGPSKMGDQDSDAVPRLASLDSAAGKSRLYAARMGRSARTLSFNLESIDLDPAATNQKDFLAPRPPTPAPSSGNSFVSWFSRIGLLLSALNCCAPRGEATSNAGTPPTPVGAEILGSAASGNSGASNISAGSSSSSSSACERAPPKNCFRLLLQGSPCTGKSTMARRFLNHDLPMFYSPTIEKYYSMVFRVEKERFELDIVDKSGYNPFPEVHRLSNITGDIFLLVFSMGCEVSFNEVKSIRERIVEMHEGAWYASGGHRTSRLRPPLPGVPIMIAGNKADLRHRRVDPAEARAFALSRPWCDFMEVVATNDASLTELFSALMRLAGLPEEMAPGRHHVLPPTTDGTISSSVHTKYTSGPMGRRKRISEPCAAQYLKPRPSLREELQVLRERSQRPPGYHPRSRGCFL